MRTTIAIATFVALGASTAGVSAIDSIPDMKGSDTLKTLTRTVIQNCAGISPAGAIFYNGTGSGNGQTALVNSALLTVTNPGAVGQTVEIPEQTIAPMSRPLNNGSNLCTTSPTLLPETEGLVVALDALSIVASTAAATTTCNAPAAAAPNTCSADPSGMRTSGTLGGENIDNWQEVLRLLYTGARNGIASGDVNVQRDCNSPARQAIVDNWQSLFQATCATCDDPSLPNKLRHAFRRDEESGTTDVFLTLLGLPTVNFAQGTSVNYDRRMANSMFCNVRRLNDDDSIAAGTLPSLPNGKVGFPIPATSQPHVSPNTWDDPQNAGVPLAAPFFPEFQDMDPLRRPCVGTGDLPLVGSEPANAATEQVCGPKGELGVVLPINPPPQGVDAPTPYPTQYCRRGSKGLADAPRNNLGVPTWCPNGDVPLGDKCYAPTTASGDFSCIAGRNACPDVVICQGLATDPSSCQGNAALKSTLAGGTCDGRVYNLHPRKSDGSYQRIERPNPSNPTGPFTSVQIVGAFYRIHTTRTLHAPFNANTCQKGSATDQLGCLPTASHCSVAYAGREAVFTSPGSVALRLNGIAPEIPCVEAVQVGPATAQYPFARKLYVNTLKGFENVGTNSWVFSAAPSPSPTYESGADNENELIKCFAGVTATTVTNTGFVPVVGTPFCEDFNEASVCNAATNVNACAPNDSAATGIPANPAFCGNGSIEYPELCDDGNWTDGDGCQKNCTLTP